MTFLVVIICLQTMAQRPTVVIKPSQIPPGQVIKQQERVKEAAKQQAVIDDFNKNAVINANTLAIYKPAAIYEIGDDFKSKYKYFKAWIKDGKVYVATDAKIKEVYLSNNFGLFTSNFHKYAVFSDNIEVSKITNQMPQGTEANIIGDVVFVDGQDQTIKFKFGKDFLVHSTK